MRIKYLLYILFFALTAFSTTAIAQDVSLANIQNIKVGALSDEQITMAWKKLQDSGVSEQDAYKLLIQKGMPAGEVDAFKNRVTLLGLNKKTGTKSTQSTEKKKIDFSRDENDTVLTPKANTAAPAPAGTNELRVYGSDFFNQTSLSFQPNFSIATPKSYVIGPGDELIVLLTGLNESSVRTKVTPEGNVQVPYAGIVYVNGFTIEQATKLIKTKMNRVYPALSSGQTQLAVNLGNTRSIKITLVGEVKTPGSYTLSALSTLFNALYNSGGPNQNGSLRNIELIRNNKVYKTVDFYAFLQQGLLDGNIRLEDQDVIHIPVYKKRVGISGEVKRPAIYELKENEQLDDLIKYAGGFTVNDYYGGNDDWKALNDYVREACGKPWEPSKPKDDPIQRMTERERAAKKDYDKAKPQDEAPKKQKPKLGPIVKTYDYTEADGTLLYQVTRHDPKDFRQRMPDGNGGWIKSLDELKGRRVLYRWPDLVKFPDATVFFCEGEKDADRLASLDHCATTVASGSWTPDCVAPLKGRHVFILEDNDDKGQKRALAAAKALHGVVASLRVVQLSDLPRLADNGPDVSDWLDEDPSHADSLVDICLGGPEWQATRRVLPEVET